MATFRSNTRSSSSTSRGPYIALLLFGIPFVGVGILMSYLSYDMISDARSVARWVEVPASIEELKLNVDRDSDGTTYQVQCRYSYEYEGTAYESERVGLSSGSDNIGSWQQDTHTRLKQLHDGGKPVPCFVNPDKPSEAVLDRSLRSGILILFVVAATVFGSAGCGMMVAGAWTLRRLARKGPDEHEKQPWLTNEDWARGIIPARAGVLALILWAFTLVWNLISFTATVFLLPTIFSEGEWWQAVFLAFPVIGLVLLLVAIRQTLIYRKFGKSHFELKTIPGKIGGTLGGNVVIVGDLPQTASVEISLACVRSVTTGSGDNERTSKDELWSDSRQVEAAATVSGEPMSIPVEFEIPEDCPPTDPGDYEERVEWTLKARAGIPGVNLALDFEVPVYHC